MSRKTWVWIAWSLFVVAWTIKHPPWEHGWINVFIGLGVALALLLFGGFLRKLEQRLDVGGARFDSETGEQLPPYREEK